MFINLKKHTSKWKYINLKFSVQQHIYSSNLFLQKDTIPHFMHIYTKTLGNLFTAQLFILNAQKIKGIIQNQLVKENQNVIYNMSNQTCNTIYI